MAPYITLTKHVYSPIPLTISEKTWQKLSPADREAVTKRAAREVADWSRKEIVATTTACSQDMSAKGAKIGASGPRAVPRSRSSRSTRKAQEKYGADVDAILADAEAVRKALPAK